MVDGDRAVSEITFAAFDFETTGLYPATDRIVEFGAVRFRAGEVLDRFSQLVNPGIPIGTEAAAVSGIGDADVQDSPPVGEIIPGFVEFLGDAVLMAHNAPFDLGFLRAAIQEHNLPDIHNSVIDTQILAIRAFPKQKSYGLQNLATELLLPPNQAHRALDDAIMCMRLFVACVEAMSFMGDLQLSAVLTTPKGGGSSTYQVP